MGFVVLLSDLFILLPNFPHSSNYLQQRANSSFDHCRWEYIRLNSEDDSLWESFPDNLQSLDAVKRYVDAFRAPLQELTHVKVEQVHALRACSLVAIPLSEDRMPPLGCFLKDLTTLNLTGWAGLVQDVAQGMKVVPLNLSMEVCTWTQWYSSSCWRSLLEWATAGSAASLPPAASVREPTSQFPQKCGAR